MTTFDKRERGFESQFAHELAVKFRATARRNNLLGLWAASKLGLAGAEAEEYAIKLVRSGATGNDDVFDTVRADFDAKKLQVSDHQINRTMEELMRRAMTEIKSKG